MSEAKTKLPTERGFTASDGSAAVWRVTADDDSQKEWDSDNYDDAFMDAEMALIDGARKVTIQIIQPPNTQAQRL